MTSNRKAKKIGHMEAQKRINRQWYRRQEVLDYPDIIHVKNDDPWRSDVVCFQHFGSAYMDVLPRPATTDDDFQTTQYVRPRLLVKAWEERIFDCIDRLKQDQAVMFADFPHDYDGNSTSKIIEGLYIALGNMSGVMRELEETGRIRPYDKEREQREFEERMAKMAEEREERERRRKENL